MSVSEVEAPVARFSGSVFLKQLRFLFKRSWDSLRQSRLGIAGFAVVLVFAVIAIFAPWISPYAKTFEAPASDRFIVNSYNLTLPTVPAGSAYGVPVMGPTTPLSSDRAPTSATRSSEILRAPGNRSGATERPQRCARTIPEM